MSPPSEQQNTLRVFLRGERDSPLGPVIHGGEGGLIGGPLDQHVPSQSETDSPQHLELPLGVTRGRAGD